MENETTLPRGLRDENINADSVGHRRNHPGDAASQYWDAAEHGSPLFEIIIRAPLPGEDSNEWLVGMTQGQAAPYRVTHRAIEPVPTRGFVIDPAVALEDQVRALVRKALRWEHEVRTGQRAAVATARLESGKASRYEYDAEAARENSGGPEAGRKKQFK